MPTTTPKGMAIVVTKQTVTHAVEPARHGMRLGLSRSVGVSGSGSGVGVRKGGVMGLGWGPMFGSGVNRAP